MLIVKEEWAKLIMSGTKTVEVRSKPTHTRGRVYISPSGVKGRGNKMVKQVVGHVLLGGCEGPLSLERYNELRSLHRVDKKIEGASDADPSQLPFEQTFAWFLYEPTHIEPVAVERRSQVWAAHQVEEAPSSDLIHARHTLSILLAASAEDAHALPAPYRDRAALCKRMDESLARWGDAALVAEAREAFGAGDARAGMARAWTSVRALVPADECGRGAP
tara:strand:- start:2952 stop:3608 length:657 start_codon:yes stop_codon:yes gene_type:complete